MKIKQILFEGWNMNVGFPVNVDEFNQRMDKHGVSIQWEKRKGHLKPAGMRMAWLQIGDGEGPNSNLELSVSKDGWVTGATGRVHNIAGKKASMTNLRKLLNKEFGSQWTMEDEPDELS